MAEQGAALNWQKGNKCNECCVWLRFRSPTFIGGSDASTTKPPKWFQFLAIVILLFNVAIGVTSMVFTIIDGQALAGLEMVQKNLSGVCSSGSLAAGLNICIATAPSAAACNPVNVSITQVPAANSGYLVLLEVVYVVDFITALLFVLHWSLSCTKRCRKRCECTESVSACFETSTWPFIFVFTLVCIVAGLTLAENAVSIKATLTALNVTLAPYSTCSVADTCGQFLALYQLGATNVTVIPLNVSLNDCSVVDPYYAGLIDELHNSYKVALPIILLAGAGIGIKIYIGYLERQNAWKKTCGV